MTSMNDRKEGVTAKNYDNPTTTDGSEIGENQAIFSLLPYVTSQSLLCLTARRKVFICDKRPYRRCCADMFANANTVQTSE